MSATGHTPDARIGSLEELPEFELRFHFDDEDDPQTVTIFQPGTDEAAATQWITVDHRYAVPLDEIS